MKVAYLTSRPLGEKILRFLIDQQRSKGNNYIDVVCLVTKSHKQMKPIDSWWQDEIQDLAKKNNIPLVSINKITNYKPDIAFSVFYYDIIPKNILENLKKGATNLHFGYLPNAEYHDKRSKNTYRGRGVLSYAILEDEKYQAVTFHYITEKIDLGPVIEYAWNKIENNTTAWDLQLKSEEKALQMFKKWLPKLVSTHDKVPTIKQATGSFRYLKAEDLQKLKNVDFGKSTQEIDRIVRAFDFPKREPAYFTIKNDNKTKKIYLTSSWQK